MLVINNFPQYFKSLYCVCVQLFWVKEICEKCSHKIQEIAVIKCWKMATGSECRNEINFDELGIHSKLVKPLSYWAGKINHLFNKTFF